MAESTIKVKMEGADNASSTIKKVAGELRELGVSANNNASNIAKGGDAIRAAMGAANGSITSAIGSVKGMTVAIQGMGIAMSTALPIAAAVAAAVAIVADVYRAMQAAHQKHLEDIKAENDRLDEQVKILKQINDERNKEAAHHARMTKFQETIDDASAVERASNAWGDKKAQREMTDQAIREAETTIADLWEKIKENNAKITATRQIQDRSLEGYHEENIYSLDERQAFAKANEEHVKAIKEAEAMLKDLRMKYQEESKEMQALKATHDRLIAAEEKLAQQKEEQRQKEKETLEKQKAAIEKQIESFKRQEQIANWRAEAQKKQQQIAELMSQDTNAKLSSAFEAGSHSTNLLLDRLSGAGQDQTNIDIRDNVRTLVNELRELNKQIADATRADQDQRQQEILNQLQEVNQKLDSFGAV